MLVLPKTELGFVLVLVQCFGGFWFFLGTGKEGFQSKLFIVVRQRIINALASPV